VTQAGKAAATQLAVGAAAQGAVKAVGNGIGGARKPATAQPHPPSPLLGANGIQVTSKTVWSGKDGLRIDVENPNPGRRAGQIHVQDSKGNKYLFDSATGTFAEAPKWVSDLLKDKDFVQGLNKGLEKYLGESAFKART
jgi:filamentous hemagglutinin